TACHPAIRQDALSQGHGIDGQLQITTAERVLLSDRSCAGFVIDDACFSHSIHGRGQINSIYFPCNANLAPVNIYRQRRRCAFLGLVLSPALGLARGLETKSLFHQIRDKASLVSQGPFFFIVEETPEPEDDFVFLVIPELAGPDIYPLLHLLEGS